MPQRHFFSLTFTLIALLVILLSAPLAHANSGGTSHHSTDDGYTAELIFPDSFLKTGPNTVVVRLRDDKGLPVSQATVQIAPVAPSAAESGEHGHSETSNDSATASGGHDDGGGASRNEALAADHEDSTAQNHDETDQSEATTEEHAYSESTSPSHTDATANEPAHDEAEPHTHPIMTQLETGTAPGTYTGVVHLDSPGTWQINVHFTDQGHDHSRTFEVTVPEPPRDWRVLGAFGGANALIIATAAVLKRRSSAGKPKPMHPVQAPQKES
jgi:hypothetical protein